MKSKTLCQSRVGNIWYGMKRRCFDPKHKHYANYGGRGIKVCERWLILQNFFEDMGWPPSDYHTLDRIENNGNYEKSNCRWATKAEQQNNRRKSKKYEFRGKSQTLRAWAFEMGLNPNTVRFRVEKFRWSIKDALTTPVISFGDGMSESRLKNLIADGRTMAKVYTIRGETLTRREWSLRTGVPANVIRARIGFGWDLERATFTPCRIRKP